MPDPIARNDQPATNNDPLPAVPTVTDLPSPLPTTNGQPPTSLVHDCALLCTPTPPLSDLQHKAIALLLAGKSDTAIACALKIHRNTVANWRKNPQFQNEMHNARQRLWARQLDHARRLVRGSLKELRGQLDDGRSDVRFRAARALLPLLTSPRLTPTMPPE